MNTLPFIWELDSNGIVSHAIGMPRGLSMLCPEHFTKNIIHYLDGKNVVFVESFIPHRGTLDAAIVDIARAIELPLKRIIAENERKAFYVHYSARINNNEAAHAYRKGDETELKKMYGPPIANLDTDNRTMLERSMPIIKAVPALLTTNLVNFLVEPSLLDLYQEKEIKVKRIQ